MSRLQGRRGLRLARIARRGFFALALISFALGFLAFDSFTVPLEAEVRRASTGIVFTGAFERVDAGLQLLAASAIPRLYVSGVNAGAGILPTRFVTQFSRRNPNIADFQRLVACCVEWGEDASNTVQNAWETKCWVDHRELAGPLLLITSRLHMARAMTALSAALPDYVIIAYPVEDALSSGHPLRGRAIEYLKYLGAIVALRLPSIVGAWLFDVPVAEPCLRAR
jgi:uncharacterized SAM-binding protein YcdF (DUF218 family)